MGVFYTTADDLYAGLTFWARGDGDEYKKRALGCLLMGLMPPKGLDDAVETLREALVYWVEQEQVRPALTPVTSESVGVDAGRGVRGTLEIAD
jgi:hypothetical protein